MHNFFVIYRSYQHEVFQIYWSIFEIYLEKIRSSIFLKNNKSLKKDLGWMTKLQRFEVPNGSKKNHAFVFDFLCEYTRYYCNVKSMIIFK